MFLSEMQARCITAVFMPRLKTESISAMIDVACNGFSILGSAQKHKVTHQSLSKNLVKLNQLKSRIINVANLFRGSYLLNENAHALLFSEVSFVDAKRILVELCEKLGGNIETGYLGEGVKLHLDGSVTCIFLNPDESYEREWAFDQNDAE